jgi:hypothetical protein
MDTHSPAPRDGAMFFGRDQLAEGLMLFRAGTLKMIRLQLAMEQRDRRVALEAVDDLVALDRQLQDYLAQLPEAPVPAELVTELEAERAALNREKLTLAAGVIRREPPALAAAAEPDPPAWGSRDYALDQQRRRRRGLRRMAAIALLIGLLGGAALVPGVAERVEVLAAGATR